MEFLQLLSLPLAQSGSCKGFLPVLLCASVVLYWLLVLWFCYRIFSATMEYINCKVESLFISIHGKTRSLQQSDNGSRNVRARWQWKLPYAESGTRKDLFKHKNCVWRYSTSAKHYDMIQKWFWQHIKENRPSFHLVLIKMSHQGIKHYIKVSPAEQWTDCRKLCHTILCKKKKKKCKGCAEVYVSVGVWMLKSGKPYVCNGVL